MQPPWSALVAHGRSPLCRLTDRDEWRTFVAVCLQRPLVPEGKQA